MLHLQSESAARWLDQVDRHLDEILIDHAHCERKAASTAMNLMNSYTENRSLCREMTRIIEEELEDVLDQRDRTKSSCEDLEMMPVCKVCQGIGKTISKRETWKRRVIGHVGLTNVAKDVITLGLVKNGSSALKQCVPALRLFAREKPPPQI